MFFIKFIVHRSDQPHDNRVFCGAPLFTVQYLCLFSSADCDWVKDDIQIELKKASNIQAIL